MKEDMGMMGMEDMYEEVKPKYPSMKGMHYADSPAGAFGGSSDNNHLSVTYDQFCNEIAADRPYHMNTTAEDGSFHFMGNQYADGPWKSGYGKDYGMTMEDNGKMPKVERTSVDVSKADRGMES